MKDSTEVLRELVMAIRGMKKETIGGILPEVRVTCDTKIRLDEALEDAELFLVHANNPK